MRRSPAYHLIWTMKNQGLYFQLPASEHTNPLRHFITSPTTASLGTAAEKLAPDVNGSDAHARDCGGASSSVGPRSASAAPSTLGRPRLGLV
jgi:hypothetical protein